jgi:hypothetical protein
LVIGYSFDNPGGEDGQEIGVFPFNNPSGESFEPNFTEGESVVSPIRRKIAIKGSKIPLSPAAMFGSNSPKVVTNETEIATKAAQMVLLVHQLLIGVELSCPEIDSRFLAISVSSFTIFSTVGPAIPTPY